LRLAALPERGSSGMDPRWAIFVVTMIFSLCLGFPAQTKGILPYLGRVALTWLIFWYLY